MQAVVLFNQIFARTKLSKWASHPRDHARCDYCGSLDMVISPAHDPPIRGYDKLVKTTLCMKCYIDGECTAMIGRSFEFASITRTIIGTAMPYRGGCCLICNKYWTLALITYYMYGPHRTFDCLQYVCKACALAQFFMQTQVSQAPSSAGPAHARGSGS